MAAKERMTSIVSNLFRIKKQKEEHEGEDHQRPSPDTLLESPPIDSFFLILELDDPEPIVGELFRRRFNIDSFPDEPRHFVAFAILEDDALLSLGYVHYTEWQGCALCGGLVVDDRHYRRLPLHLRQSIKASGGIAELLLRRTFEKLPDTTVAIWGYVGDSQSEKVCLRVGFEKTDKQYLLAVWRSADLTPEEKDSWIERAYEITPF